MVAERQQKQTQQMEEEKPVEQILVRHHNLHTRSFRFNNTLAFAFFFAFAGLPEFPVCITLSSPPFTPSPGVCTTEAVPEATDGGFALGVLGVDGGDEGGDGPGDAGAAAGTVTKVGVIP